MGETVHLVWNKGIAALCDRRFPDEFPDGRNYKPVPAYAGAMWSSRLPQRLIPEESAKGEIREGDLVWVRLSWLKSFIGQVLPWVKANFVLVTGDSDSCVPSELGREARAVLECSKVVHWYTQNYDGSAPSERISAIPIGIDFHMISERTSWGEEVSSPQEQERALVAMGKGFPPLPERQQRVYVDFGWQREFGLYRRLRPLKGTRFHESRRQIGKKLRGNALVCSQSGPLPRREMWRRRGEYAFVLSPHGMGLDCHRTWEALALGHIVLAPSSSLDPLYVDLPVVPLTSWSEITPENLERWRSQHSQGVTDHERLRSCYWVTAMRRSGDDFATSGVGVANRSVESDGPDSHEHE